MIKNCLKKGMAQIPSRKLKQRIHLTLFKTKGISPRELLINQGDVAVMVGTPNANRVHQFAFLTGVDGSVLFIEPAPRNQKILRNAAIEHPNVTVDERGAWSERDKQELLLGGESNPADNKIPVEGIEHDNDYRPDNYVDSIEIQVETLDTILYDHAIDPDYVEIMVNGAELQILEGATEMLSTSDPRLLVKGHARDTDNEEPINRRIRDHLDRFGYHTVIGASGNPTVGETDEWQHRDGDVYAWK